MKQTVQRWLCGALGVALVVSAAAGCKSPVLVPVVFEPQDRQERVPVVFIPGTTGTALIDRETAAMRWGTVGALLRPRDQGYELALPIPADHPEADRGLIPSHALRELRIRGLYRKPIYGPWVDVMEANGYRTGDLQSPQADDSFFLFAYDWRESNIDAARSLFDALERLRRVRGDSKLRVNLIAQSNGALIARYLARFGGASLEQAESGRASPPETLVIEKILLVGVANGGAIRVLREMHRGRTYLPRLGRNWAPEVLFTFPGLYEGLPTYRERFLVDDDGEKLEIDLFDVEDWVRYEWSIFAKKSERRADRTPELFGDRAGRIDYAREQLRRAQRLHRLLLDDPPGFVPPRYLLIRNGLTSTPDRAHVRETPQGWRLDFSDQKRILRNPLLRAATEAPGDEHATLTSQTHLSALERAALEGEPFFAVGGHFEMILNPAAQKRCLEFLRRP